MNQLLKDQRKEQILSAALNVISKKGYDQSRMDDIVTKSNLSKGAIYWYYKSKKEIYLSLIDHWVSEYSSGVFEEIENIESPSEKLKKLFHFFLTQFKNNPVTFKVLVEFWRMASLDISFNKKLQTVYQDFQDYLINIIDLGIKKGEFKKVDSRITALSILINIEGIHWFTLFDKSGVQAQEYIDTITDFILTGLKRKV
tara:strand:+ start:2104 stop:2700 length:597 start_codon:yes stop_codon:yes gene_type:complete